ncbi:MAG: YkgJ family cysteine cluster protein [Candidatus Bathyarchaeota archaeon]|nr:YkgJ family cysteine cluster protein [Candidatus Bathyarchaeota archaeon]
MNLERREYDEAKLEEVRHSLAKGIPCVRHKCAECCLETRMPLSNHDLKRVLKLGYKLECFAAKTDEGWRLKNDSGRCVFLIEERCGIYPHRPEGCRLYPLVYNETLKKAVIDPLCPYGYLFKVQKNDVIRLKALFEKLTRLEV